MKKTNTVDDGKKVAEPKMLSLSGVRAKFGLSPSWLKRLGEPDKVKDNPHHPHFAPMKLYEEDRVVRFIEANAEEYFRAQEKRRRLSEAQKKVQERKRQETLEWARTVEIVLRTFPKDPMASAIRHFSRRESWRHDNLDGPNDRGVVAMLRHQNTNYERILRELFNRTGCLGAYYVIRDRVNRAVLEELDRRGYAVDDYVREEILRGTEVPGMIAAEAAA